MTDLHTSATAGAAATQHEIDRRMLEQYRPDTRDALEEALEAILLQVDPDWLEQSFGPYPEPGGLARLFALTFRREALLEGEAKIRVMAAIAEERAGWPGSLEAMTAGADLLHDMPCKAPPAGPGAPRPQKPQPIALVWTDKVTTNHTDGSAVVECTTSDGRPAELHLDEEHVGALGDMLSDPPEAGWDDEAGGPESETAREHPAS
ncbi:hypothetical protein [Streptomyces sp. AC1-42T]|uniref:hypothetical protein n=1 Tax=Streptomyces sp. AC1-42T TaxID=2218665 RepID=UPI000DAD2EB8|nr:hypothetical protein [Streptomyces sp. AC1-42T]PZT71425.1 hypothetical protein DNK55_32445 [Streptomyces sp. AC1-42T]